MEDKKAILVNYNFDPQDWWIKFGYKTENVLIYDRSDDGVNRQFSATVIKTENRGNVDFDKLSYLVENYDSLPDVFLWGKTNLFKYISEEEYDRVAQNKVFTPLLTENHKTYSDQFGPVCYYQDGVYYERNNSWYVPELTWKYFSNYSQFASAFMLPNPLYLPFAPGGNYILTKETVHKYSPDFYRNMASVLDYCREPAEAQMCERSYYNLWR